jgi:hypothetical protein
MRSLGRDNWGFSPVHQWLANRYAVLSVNFRARLAGSLRQRRN